MVTFFRTTLTHHIKTVITSTILLATTGIPMTAHAATTNLIANPSAETADSTGTPAGWLQGQWGSNTTQFSYATDGHTGSRSLKVTTSAYTSGDAKWYFAPVTITGGAKYTFSDYYKSTVATEVVAQYMNASGAASYVSLGTAAASSSWKQITADFTAPASAKNITVFHYLAAVGQLQVDDYNLNAASITPPPTGIQNPSFETADPANGNKPQYWTSNSWGTNNAKPTYGTTGRTGSRSTKVVITNYTDGDAKWISAPVSVTPGQNYTFTDYYKSTVATEVAATLTMQDGTQQYFYIGTPAASPTDWSKFTRDITMPQGASQLTFMHILYQAGTLSTDDFSLTPRIVTGFSQPIVSLTFDDAWRSIYTNGLPLLQKYHMLSTQYMLSGVTTDPAYMTKAMMKQFATDGHEIASHTVNHLDLTTVNAAKLNNELKNSQTNLQKWTDQTVTDFATPYGSYNDTVINAIKTYYRSHRSTDEGYNTKDNFDIYNIKVQNITDTTTTAQVTNWVNEAKAQKAWLVLVYHQVDTDPQAGEYNTPPDQLDAQLGAIQASGIKVDTVNQALNEITPQL
jgi:peptidoglycan/xylan/chitin deacetylase (PgdA/CDA1 family)